MNPTRLNINPIIAFFLLILDLIPSIENTVPNSNIIIATINPNTLKKARIAKKATLSANNIKGKHIVESIPQIKVIKPTINPTLAKTFQGPLSTNE